MKKLNNNETKERLAWFQEWRLSIPKKIDIWKMGLSEDIKNKLDFTPESLKFLEEYLLKIFREPNETRNIANSDILDAISTYIGEVFIKNMPDSPKWDVDLTKLDSGSDEYYFFPYLKRESPFIGINPFTLLPSIVKLRQGDKLTNFYKKQLSVYFKKKGISETSQINKISKIPGKGGYCYQYFLLIKTDPYHLQETEKVLKTYYTKKGLGDKVRFHSENHLLVDMGNEYCFHFQLYTSDSVLQESKEIAESYKGNKDKAIIASCKCRLEFWGDEDPDGDYLNDHMFILEQIMKNEKLLIYDYRNGVFFDEM